MNDEKLAIQTLQELLDSNFFGVLQKMAFNLAISALEKQEIYEEELEMIYKMANDMALTGNVPSSKEHAEAIQNYLDWVEAGQMVAEVENE
jgi:parvulin-like peptidyl-prolyl isomerase